MSLQIDLDFAKETLSKTVLDIFRNGLQGNPDQSGSKQTYEECLRTLSQGKKLQYGAANFLLLGIVRSLGIGNCSPDDEFQPGERQYDKDLGKDPTLSQIMSDTSSQKKGSDTTQDQDDTIHGSELGASGSGLTKTKNGMESKPERESNPRQTDKSDKADKKAKALCRFYNNGKCKYGADCRFPHPKICPKFRQHGECITKGCQGGCEFLHPNVCRTSLKDRTCTYPECKFFHLKGTKVIERKQHANASSQNWRAQNQNNNQQGQNKDQRRSGANKSLSNNASKNWQTSLNAGTKKKAQNPNKEHKPERKEGTGEETKRIEMTLEAIMKRLDAMEARPSFYPQSGLQLRPQIQPMLSPAVPQPGTQTQYQWASQPPWTPSQTQYHQ
jgi:hypothetical protein